MSDKMVCLWSKSVQGLSGGKRVHIGEQACFYPLEHKVVIERWGPNGTKSQIVYIPESIESPNTVILYLQGRVNGIPQNVLHSASESSTARYKDLFPLVLPNGKKETIRGKTICCTETLEPGSRTFCFRWDNHEVCSITRCEGFQTYVMINGMGKSWICCYETHATFAPGLSAIDIKDNETKQTAFQLKWVKASQYDMLFPNCVLHAYLHDDRTSHYRSSDTQVARCSFGEAQPKSSDQTHLTERQYMFLFDETIDTENILAILAFPSLTFAHPE